LKKLAKTFLERALRRPGNINALIRQTGSFATQQCRVLDISRRDVRLQVVDADNIPDRFLLLFSNSGPVYHASVTRRRGTQVGAQFMPDQRIYIARTSERPLKKRFRKFFQSPSPVRLAFQAVAPSHHNLFSAVSIADIAESRFSTLTGYDGWADVVSACRGGTARTASMQAQGYGNSAESLRK
jgi:hypothetical protein